MAVMREDRRVEHARATVVKEARLLRDSPTAVRCA